MPCSNGLVPLATAELSHCATTQSSMSDESTGVAAEKLADPKSEIRSSEPVDLNSLKLSTLG